MTTLTTDASGAIEKWADSFNPIAGQALIDAAARSPYLASQFNQFVADGGSFVASNDRAASAESTSGGIRIKVGQQLANNYLSTSVAKDQLATVFAHELGHALSLGGMTAGTVIPPQAVESSRRAEGVALTSEMIVSYQLGLGSNGNYSHSDQGGLKQSPGTLSELFSQNIALEFDAVSLWTLDSALAQSFVNYSVSPIAKIYGTWSGQATPSVAPKLTYDQYNEAWAALNACGPENSPQSINWEIVEPESVQLNTNPDGSCRITTPKLLPRLNGSSLSLDAVLDPFGNPMSVSAKVDLTNDGTPDQTTTTGYTYSDNNADYQTDTTVTDNSSGQVLSKTLKEVEFKEDEKGISRTEDITTYAAGKATTLRTAYDVDNQPGTPVDVTAPSALSNLTAAQSSAIFSDVSGLLNAIRAGNPLPATVSGLRLLNTLDGLDGRADIPNLGAVSQVGAGALSFYNLYNAIQSGDSFGQVNATLSALNYANIALNGTVNAAGSITFAANSTASSLNSTLNGTGLANGAPGVLPAIGLIASIKAKDPIGIAQSAISLYNSSLLFTSGAGFTPLGWFFIGASILQTIFAKTPKAWGVANVSYGEGFDNHSLIVNSSGEASGPARAQGQLQSLIDGIQGQLNSTNAGRPEDQQLGLIAQRMPGLSWRASDLDNMGYQLTDIDPLSAAQRMPYRRFDDEGTPFSANPELYQVDPSDPEQRQGLDQVLLSAALRRGAIAPMWEVKTAKRQQDAGAADAGLTEEERAAKAGYAAALDSAYAQANPTSPEAQNKRVGHFMPVALDVDADGHISTSALSGSQVSFNWDGLGFQKPTAWVNANDAFLVLDRDFNQSVDSGTELLSNPLVADPAKGLRSLVTWDANADGRIDASDPIYRQLKVWQDLNQDGDNTQATVLSTAAGPKSATVQDQGLVNGKNTLELNSLADWGITAIDYANNRYEFDTGLRSSGVANGQYLPEWPTTCKRRTSKAPMAGMGKCSALSAKGNTWRHAA